MRRALALLALLALATVSAAASEKPGRFTGDRAAVRTSSKREGSSNAQFARPLQAFASCSTWPRCPLCPRALPKPKPKRVSAGRCWRSRRGSGLQPPGPSCLAKFFFSAFPVRNRRRLRGGVEHARQGTGERRLGGDLCTAGAAAAAAPRSSQPTPPSPAAKKKPPPPPPTKSTAFAEASANAFAKGANSQAGARSPPPAPPPPPRYSLLCAPSAL